MAGVGHVFDTREVECGKLVDESNRHVRGYNHCSAAVSDISLLCGYGKALVLIENVDCFNSGAHGKMNTCELDRNCPSVASLGLPRTFESREKFNRTLTILESRCISTNPKHFTLFGSSSQHVEYIMVHMITGFLRFQSSVPSDFMIEYKSTPGISEPRAIAIYKGSRAIMNRRSPWFFTSSSIRPAQVPSNAGLI